MCRLTASGEAPIRAAITETVGSWIDSRESPLMSATSLTSPAKRRVTDPVQSIVIW
ncbi:hypothetical protein [Thiocapsa roseopersicina]|uniref:Uncharacterized protein n=1 Tax=Thiocapsa roseopersicina TaxID=1058 RepID=A0A1H3C550_THIRO|nr:hypothetical protein [Thiocapsa roseopersicina]SDX49028.1 hypothetical protein SAMN05421783_13015 [Thiocapsa roseopersicina]